MACANWVRLKELQLDVVTLEDAALHAALGGRDAPYSLGKLRFPRSFLGPSTANATVGRMEAVAVDAPCPCILAVHGCQSI